MWVMEKTLSPPSLHASAHFSRRPRWRQWRAVTAQPGASLRTRQWSVVGDEHAGVHRVLRDLDDVRGDRHPDQEDARPERHAVRAAHRDAGADRLADPRAARHVDRQVRRPDRLLPADARDRRADLADRLRDRVLALPGAGAVRRPGRRLVLGRHAVRRPLVRQEAPGLRDGRVRRRQLGRGRDEVRRAGARGRRSAGRWCRRSTPWRCWSPRSPSGSSPTATRSTWSRATSPTGASSKCCATRPSGSTASTTRSCSAATSPCRCGWSITTSASSASTSASPRCWPRASRCRAACCAPSAAGCRTSGARTR